MRIIRASFMEDCEIYDEDEKITLRIEAGDYTFQAIDIQSRGPGVASCHVQTMSYKIRRVNGDNLAVIDAGEFDKLKEEGKIILLEQA